MKKSFVKDSLLFTKYLPLFVCLLIFVYLSRIQTTLSEQERNIIKKIQIKRTISCKTVGRELYMFYDLTYNKEFISKIEINYSFSMR